MIEFHIKGKAEPVRFVIEVYATLVERFDDGDPTEIDCVVRVAEEVDAFTVACKAYSIFCERL
jgi:hypothetical protein